jgi:hypothetical protein
LKLLDPLVAILLFLKPKPAAIMLIILMASDVVNNTWVVLKYGGRVGCGRPMVFLVFILTTIDRTVIPSRSQGGQQSAIRRAMASGADGHDHLAFAVR